MALDRSSDALIDRAAGALTGVALGDATGMPSQTMTRAQIAETYGIISGLTAPCADHPVSHGLRAGMVTDDTEQTVLLADQLVRGGGTIDDRLWAEALLNWEAGVRSRGLRDLLGPSSKAALLALQSGVSAGQAGRGGTTNGAAMRIAPVGIANPPDDLAALAGRVAAACRVTHNTGEAIAAASAVAAVISLGVDGAAFDETLDRALSAARIGNRLGFPEGEPDMAGRIALALDVADRTGSEAALAEAVGTSVASRSSVAAAFGVVRLAGGDPWKAALIAANIGDDTDTIGSIAAAMAGACRGLSAFGDDRTEQVLRINALDPAGLARALVAIRLRTGTGDAGRRAAS